MRGRPEFALAMWNVLERLDHELPRETNGCEGYHNAINRAMSCSHPTLFKFLETLKKEFAVSWTKYLQYKSGMGQAKTKKSQLLTQRLAKIVMAKKTLVRLSI